MLGDSTGMDRRDANFKMDYQHKKVTNTVRGEVEYFALNLKRQNIH